MPTRRGAPLTVLVRAIAELFIIELGTCYLVRFFLDRVNCRCRSRLEVCGQTRNNKRHNATKNKMAKAFPSGALLSRCKLQGKSAISVEHLPKRKRLTVSYSFLYQVPGNVRSVWSSCSYLYHHGPYISDQCRIFPNIPRVAAAGSRVFTCSMCSHVPCTSFILPVPAARKAWRAMIRTTRCPILLSEGLASTSLELLAVTGGRSFHRMSREIVILQLLHDVCYLRYTRYFEVERYFVPVVFLAGKA